MTLAYSGKHPKNALYSECQDIYYLREAINNALDGSRTLYVGSSATAMRFMLSFLSTLTHKTILKGSEQLHKRSIAPLVDALRALGAKIEYLEQIGYPPVYISGPLNFNISEVDIDASASSQYISSLMLLAPLFNNGLRITNTGKETSLPYIHITAEVIRQCGISVKKVNNQISIPKGSYAQHHIPPEGDWSAASYFYLHMALGTPGDSIIIKNLCPQSTSLQGDAEIARIFEQLGVATRFSDDGTATLLHTSTPIPTFFTWNMEHIPDTVPALTVALCALKIPFQLTGTSRLKLKESNRSMVLKTELAKRGFLIKTTDDSIEYDGNHVPDSGAEVNPHNDHRIAMALAPLARYNALTIIDFNCTKKSFPDFFTQFSLLGYTCTEL